MTIEGRYQGFEVELRDDGVAVFTFTNPERLNAISQPGRWDLEAALSAAQFDDDVRVIVITGTGRGFLAGVAGSRPDRSQREEWDDEPPVAAPRLPNYRNVPINRYEILVHLSQQGARAVRRLDKLSIAAVNGYAIQWGLSLALACDFVICARSAQLASATLRTAFQPDEGGHWLLVQHLGVRKALEFMLLNKFVSAEEAVEMGLANEVVDDKQLMTRSLELATQLAQGPQVAMRMLKKATYLAAELTFDQAGEDMAIRTALTDFHEDVDEGQAAFWSRPRRKPTYNKWLEAEHQTTK
jgi:2-(1,2-epoxy-1,2-dihydrophenyl)acetyl-CoA isomerase